MVNIHHCDFLVGDAGMVMVLPDVLPPAANHTIVVTPNKISIEAGPTRDVVASWTYQDKNGALFDEFSKSVQVGIVEAPPGAPFSAELTKTAYVRAMRLP